MQLKSIKLKNIGLFSDQEISIAPTLKNHSNITIFIGRNGAGKTSILKSIATSLSWFISRLRTEKGVGNSILEEEILNKANAGLIEIAVEIDDSQIQYQDRSKDDYFQWTLAKLRRGRSSSFASNLIACTRLAEVYRDSLTNDDTASLPLIAFYPVERIVLDIPLKIRTKHTFFQLDAYDNSLNQGVDFRRFFEWFREREDAENESTISEDFFSQIPLFDVTPEFWERLKQLNASAKDRQLMAVRTAISQFMPHMKNLRVRRKPRLHMTIDKHGETLNVAQLSQGEKSLMALVGDIARRLAMLNPGLDNPLTGKGIVLIDEIDLHLHPSWQRKICEHLAETFPNCQFVLTTHSSLVISDYKDVLLYGLSDGEVHELPPQYGQDVNTVLLEIMDTRIRSQAIDERLGDLLDAIQDVNLELARSLLAQLSQELPENHIELIKAKLLLRKQELRHASH
ncbi:MAG: ATP-binding protein [Limnothrix sp. CACIAM 69d]|nr:MAG: ATP-binding protein [Limnothrix sp. CACIAM 69d]